MPHATTDPSLYPSPRSAIEAPPETIGYVALVEPDQRSRPDAFGVLDLDSSSETYGELVSTLELPNVGDELHHFGWNACSSALCSSGHHAHAERRYLLLPGLGPSRTYVLDTKPDPR